MLIFIVVIIGLSILILGHEAGHFLAAKLFGLKVDEFGFGFPPRIFAWGKGETKYSLNWLPFGGFVKIAGEEGEFALVDGDKAGPRNAENEKRLFSRQPAWKKSVVILAGVFTNLVLGWLLISLVLMIGAPQTLVVSGTEPGSPAATAGFAQGDVVKNFSTYQDFVSFVNANRGKEITIPVLRNGKEVDVAVTPRLSNTPDQGAIGVALEEGGTARENPFAALKDGFLDTGVILWLTLQAFGGLIVQIFAHASLPQGVVGPVGIVGIAEETGRIGFAYLLQLLGIISLNLTIVNCIPFPALDGGRFLVILIEKMKGSALSERVQGTINGLGFILLIALMVVLTVRDVGNLF